jgi:hypothetical protein
VPRIVGAEDNLEILPQADTQVVEVYGAHRPAAFAEAAALYLQRKPLRIPAVSAQPVAPPPIQESLNIEEFRAGQEHREEIVLLID